MKTPRRRGNTKARTPRQILNLAAERGVAIRGLGKLRPAQRAEAEQHLAALASMLTTKSYETVGGETVTHLAVRPGKGAVFLERTKGNKFREVKPRPIPGYKSPKKVR